MFVDGDIAIEVDVHAPEHLPHATLADLLDDLVAVTDHFVDRRSCLA